jgi:hypothetical protein
MQVEQCEDCGRLYSEALSCLEKVVKLSAAQVEAFRGRDQRMFARLDDALETARAQRERAIRALAQHRENHGWERWD